MRLDDELVDAVDALAAQMGTDRTDLIARGLRRELLYEGRREFVYVLLDAGGDVRYVGRSCEPYKRLREHVAQARVGGSAKEAWLAQSIAVGHVPRLVIIDDAPSGAEIAELEAEWIEHFAASGRLTNGTRAGVASGERAARGSVRMHIVVSDDLLARIDDALPDGVSRAHFIRRAIESALPSSWPLDQPRATVAVPGRKAAPRASPSVAAAAKQPASAAPSRPDYAAERQARLNAGKERGKR